MHQPELEMFQIAQAAVDQPGRPARRPSGKVVFFEQDDREPAQGGIAGNGRAVDTSADDGEIEPALIEIGGHQTFHGYIVRPIA